MDLVEDDETWVVRSSGEYQDEGWDRFLQQIPSGEFQQTSCWARVKRIDGWRCHRVVLTRGQKILGGFQMLWRKSRWGKIGYVSKGPVVENESAGLMTDLVGHLKRTANRLGLIAMMVHPPQAGALSASLLIKNRFAPNRLMDIVTATLVVNVSKGMEAIEAGMRKRTRYLLRRAFRNNLSVCEGGAEDIGTFFELMLATCKRQGVDPNPSSAASLKALWEESRIFGGCRLTFAEHQGCSIAGLFCIPFRGTVTIWKKGSIPEYLYLNPVEMLYHEAMSWANKNGYHYVDFVSLDRNIAESRINKVPLTPEQRKSRDIFNLGFGGDPVILPEAYIYFTNPFIHQGYRLLFHHEVISRRMKKIGVTSGLTSA